MGPCLSCYLHATLLSAITREYWSTVEARIDRCGPSGRNEPFLRICATLRMLRRTSDRTTVPVLEVG